MLFIDIPYANAYALVIFIIAAITDAYDGYYARKYKLVTQEGIFLDPLADKILVSSAFISFAILDIVEHWMVFFIVFRDLFVTGLRMVMISRGFNLVTSNIAKAKTGLQIGIIIFILLFLGLKNMHVSEINWIVQLISGIKIIYYLMLLMTVFTTYTGIVYLYKNRYTIKKQFLN